MPGRGWNGGCLDSDSGGDQPQFSAVDTTQLYDDPGLRRLDQLAVNAACAPDGVILTGDNDGDPTTARQRERHDHLVAGTVGLGQQVGDDRVGRTLDHLVRDGGVERLQGDAINCRTHD